MATSSGVHAADAERCGSRPRYCSFACSFQKK